MIIKGYDETKRDRRRMARTFQSEHSRKPEYVAVPPIKNTALSAKPKEARTAVIARGHLTLSKAAPRRLSLRTLGSGMLCLMAGVSIGVVCGLHRWGFHAALIAGIIVGNGIALLLRRFSR